MRKEAFIVYYDDETGDFEKVQFFEGFLKESFLMQADILNDTLNNIEPAYKKAFDGFVKSLQKKEVK